jgi:hypothetical protein
MTDQQEMTEMGIDFGAGPAIAPWKERNQVVESPERLPQE